VSVLASAHTASSISRSVCSVWIALGFTPSLSSFSANIFQSAAALFAISQVSCRVQLKMKSDGGKGTKNNDTGGGKPGRRQSIPDLRFFQ
jgi:hypothetical protein